MHATVRGGKDTWAGSGNASLNHNGAKFLRLQTGAAYAYVYLKNPVPRGATVVSATLTLHARLASSGSRTLTVRRISDSWKASQLNWNNKPGVTGSSQPTATLGTVADGDAITFDITTHLQTVVNGSSHYGWRIETTASTAHKLYGFEAGDFKPTLDVTWSDKPAAPTSLSPSAAAIAVSKPILQFDYDDTSGSTDLTSVQAQVDPSANATTPAFDSGEVASTVPELDLSTTAYAGLADGSSTQWRARVKDTSGLWSDWSDWVTFSRDDKGTLTITNPAVTPNNYVSEPTPPIIWSLTGETQAFYQVRITPASDRTKILYDSGKIKGAANSLTIPEKANGKRVLVDHSTYSVNVRIWDTKVREKNGGEPVYTRAWQDFTVNESATVAAPASLTAAQSGATPFVALTWTRSTAPDSWNILRDGKVIAANVDPADTLTTGTTHVFTDQSAAPQVAHTYQVRAVVNGVQSQQSNTANVTTAPIGIWLLDVDRNLAAVIFGNDSGSFSSHDQAATYAPLGSDYAVRVNNDGGGSLEGSISGVLIDARGYAAADQEAVLRQYKDNRDTTYQLVLADTSIPVAIGDLTIAPTPEGSAGDIIKAVSFNFWQAGEA